MTTTFRYPRSATYLAIGGQPVDVPFVNVRCSGGFDQPVMTAEFTVPYLTARLRLNNTITMFIGASPAIPTSFVGYIVGYQRSLYPLGVTVLCEGPLTLARYKPDEDIDLAGFTEEVAIGLVLNNCGIPPSKRLILGDGNILGQGVLSTADQRFVWRKGQEGLAFIQALDQVSFGYRTFDAGGSGLVLRRTVSGLALADPAYQFTEHVDISLGSSEWSLEQGAIGVEVQGSMGPSGDQFVAGQPRTGLGTGFARIQSQIIETQGQADLVATWAQRELGRPLVRASVTTYRDDPVRWGQTVAIDALTRLGLQRRCWAQNVVRELSETGQFSQTMQVLSEVLQDTSTEIPGLPTDYGGTQETVPPEIGEPGLADPIADFLFENIDHEFTDLGVEFWIVVVRSASYAVSGTITALAWSTDTTTVPETGSDALFITKITDLATVITLDVTDSGARTASVAKACNGADATAVTRDRHLYVAGSSLAVAYDGAGNWNTQALSTAVVGNGPIWGAAGDVDVSNDDLATAPGASPVFSGENVSSVFVETDVSASNAYAGGDGGSAARSTDGASTWTLVTSPSANEIYRIIASRYNPGEVLVLDSAGDVYQSLNFGGSWGLLFNHPGAVDLAQSNFRNWVGGSFGVKVMESGASATWPGSTPNIVAIAAHIREDIVYALADDGTTYYISPAGGLAMVAGASLPSGTAQVRGLNRDGAAVDLLYIAAGDRLIKSHDGLRTTAGYTVIYTGDSVMVGYGDYPLAFTPPTPPDTASLFGINSGSVSGLIPGNTWQSRGTTGFGSTPRFFVAWATDANNVHLVTGDGRSDSTDGGNTFSDTAGNFPLAQPKAYLLRRNGAFYLFGQGSGGAGGGGIFGSADGISWALVTGTEDINIGGTFKSLTDWTRTESHLYFTQPYDLFPQRKLYMDSIANEITLPNGWTLTVGEATSSASMWGGKANDVALFQYLETASATDRVLIRIQGGVADEVTPGALINANDSLGDLTSPDGVTWVGWLLLGLASTMQLVRSGDSGATWAVVQDVGAVSYESILYDPTTPTTWYANAGGVLYISTDNGVTWTTHPATGTGFRNIFGIGSLDT